jgi:hypothetical protein
MEWALQDFPGVHDILEYESRGHLEEPDLWTDRGR